MTDLELLERAAKAAGLTLEWHESVTQTTFPMGDINKPKREVLGWDGPYIAGTQDRWRPLHDDGDALRLAVKLDISVDLAASDRWCLVDAPWRRYNGGEKVPHVEEDYGAVPPIDTKMAAIRRAIVRAAAEMAL